MTGDALGSEEGCREEGDPVAGTEVVGTELGADVGVFKKKIIITKMLRASIHNARLATETEAGTPQKRRSLAQRLGRRMHLLAYFST